MAPTKAKIRVQAPANLEPIDIAQAVVGNGLVVKAEPKPRYGKRTFQDYKPMLTLTDRFEKAYDKQLDKIVREIRGYIESTIKVKLTKADDRKPLFTPAELFELQQIIEDYHKAFIAGTVGPDTLPPGDVSRLIDAGILPEDLRHTFVPSAKELPPKAMEAIEDAYRYGHVLAASRTYEDKKRRHGLSYEQFVRNYAPKVPMGPNQKQALDWAKHSAATEIKGLGNKVAADFTALAIEADRDLRRKYTGVIRDATAENIERQKTWRQLASDLGHKTGDWSRDFKRIAATEKQKAMQEGIVTGLVGRYGDPEDIRVAKRPNPDACPHCLRLHKHRDGRLRIFKLTELIENGSNVGRKAADWKATVGPVHPWCAPAGALVHTPQGLKPIEQISTKNYVMTHRGRWMPVTSTMSRALDGELVLIDAGQHRLRVTPEHPVLTQNGWTAAGKIEPGDHVLVASVRPRPTEHRIDRLIGEARQRIHRFWHGRHFDPRQESKLWGDIALSLVQTCQFAFDSPDGPDVPIQNRSPDPSLIVLQKTARFPIYVDFMHERVTFNVGVVRKVKRVPFKGTVYNFSVENDESYICEGFVVHNCGCEIIHVPEGWGFDESGEMLPESLLRSDWLAWDLRKALPKPKAQAPTLSYGESRPDKGVVVRVGDPLMSAEIHKIIDRTPPEIFNKDVGITFITTDIPRVQNPLDEHDFAYWSGNEIRISQTLPVERIARVLPHEIGHSLNVHLIHKFGDLEKVKTWHRELDAISAEEGYVSDYAKREPIENAAEVSMLYLYHRQKLMIRWPRQFAFVHRAYKDIWQ